MFNNPHEQDLRKGPEITLGVGDLFLPADRVGDLFYEAPSLMQTLQQKRFAIAFTINNGTAFYIHSPKSRLAEMATILDAHPAEETGYFGRALERNLLDYNLLQAQQEYARLIFAAGQGQRSSTFDQELQALRDSIRNGIRLQTAIHLLNARLQSLHFSPPGLFSTEQLKEYVDNLNEIDSFLEPETQHIKKLP